MTPSTFNPRAGRAACRFTCLRATRLRFPAGPSFRTQPRRRAADSAVMSKSPLFRARSVALVLMSFLSMSACGTDPAPPTRDEVIFACGTYNLEACRTFGRCLGWTDAETQACVNEENAKCADELQTESCWEAQRDALDRCAADVADDSCPDVCNANGFCFSPCSYFCPSSAR